MKSLDPELAAIAAAMPADAPSLFELDPPVAREIFAGIAEQKPAANVKGVNIEDITLSEGPDTLGLRIYRPHNLNSDASIVFLHGGGYMLGSTSLMDGEALFIAEATGSVVVSVDYRLAPEHPLPAAHEDALAALDWVDRNVLSLGGNPDKVCIAGESAGANLAASAMIARRDQGKPLAAALLVVPAPDLGAIARIADSDQTFPMLTPHDLRAITRICVNDAAELDRFPASVAAVEDMAGLPPTVVALAGHCPTRSIGEQFVDRLISAGNRVECLDFEDMFHPFLAFTHASAGAKKASQRMCEAFLAYLK